MVAYHPNGAKLSHARGSSLKSPDEECVQKCTHATHTQGQTRAYVVTTAHSGRIFAIT